MLKPTNYQTPELTWNLARYGYELAVTKDEEKILEEIKAGKREPLKEYGVEELIVRILAHNPDPRYIGGIPVIIGKNKVDYAKLFSLADREVHWKLGWILSHAKNDFNNLDIEYNNQSDLETTIEMCRYAIPNKEGVLDSTMDCRAYRKIAERQRGSIDIEWRMLEFYGDKFIETMRLYNVQQRKAA